MHRSLHIPLATTFDYHFGKWYHGWYTALVSWVVDLLAPTFTKIKGRKNLNSSFSALKGKGFLVSLTLALRWEGWGLSSCVDKNKTRTRGRTRETEVAS